MDQVWLKDALRNIRSRFVSWLSIAIIVFIGTDIILGILFAGHSTKKHAENYYKEHNYKDLDLSSNFGAKESEIEDILRTEGVVDAEGLISMPGIMSYDGANRKLTILSATERISVPYAVEGRLPEKVGECAVCIDIANETGIKAGDTIMLSSDSDTLEDVLTEKNYTVTGIAGHPDYVSSGDGDFCILPLSSFDMSDILFDYTNVFVKADIPESIGALSSKYDGAIAGTEKALEEKTKVLGEERDKSLAQELDDKLADARAEADEKLGDAQKEIDDAQKEFDDKVAEAQKELDDAQKELDDAKETLDRELKNGAQKIKDGEKEYNDKVANGEKELEQAEKDMEKEINDTKFKLFDSMLQIDKNEKLLAEKEEEYKKAQERLESGKDEYNKGKAEYDSGVKQLGDELGSDSLNLLQSVISMMAGQGMLPEDTADEMVASLEAAKSASPLEKAKTIISVVESNSVTKELLHDAAHIDELKAAVSKLDAAKAKLDDARSTIKNGEEELEDARKELDQGWFSLEQAKKELADGQAAFAAEEPKARQKLADAKAEFEKQKEDGKKQLEDARKEYNTKKADAEKELADAEKELEDAKEEFKTKKADGEEKLADARAEYADAKKEAEEKLDDAESDIESAKETPCQWIIQTRNASAHFTVVKSMVDVVGQFCLLLTPMYSIVVIIVCFFTIAIMVEEQKAQIGTLKANGMYKHEIRRKYLIFGVSGGLFGVLLGYGGAYAYEAMILVSQKGRLNFGTVHHAAHIVPVVLMPVAVALVTAIAVYWSSEKLISCTAVGLISGNEPKRKEITKAGKNSNSNIYLNMIFKNLYTDLGRELVSVVIVMACVLLIAVGVTLNLAFAGSLDKQIGDVWRYDIKIVVSDTANDKEKEQVEDAIKGYEYTCVSNFGAIIQTDKKQIPAEAFCIDDREEFSRYYKVRDDKGRDVVIPDDSVLVSREMMQKDKLTKGSATTLITDELKVGRINIGDDYIQYVGKCIIMSKACYKAIYGKEAKSNCYLIKTGSVPIDDVYNELKTLGAVSAIDRSSEIRIKYKSYVDVFNAIVFLLIGFSALLAFMVLLNLSNILVLHRMREILTLRVNGYSNFQVILYLGGEVLVTTGLGLLMGVIIGIPFGVVAIMNMETAGFMYVRTPFAIAWVLGVLLVGLFAVIIYSIAFSKVKKIPLTDITKY